MLLLGVIFALGFLISAISGISLSVQAYIFVALVGTALGGYLILIYAMMGNVVDYDEIINHRRREAIYYGTFSFAIGIGIPCGQYLRIIIITIELTIGITYTISAIFTWVTKIKAFGNLPPKTVFTLPPSSHQPA